MKICPRCDEHHSKDGTYCSRVCANSRKWSEDDKNKKSIANKGNVPWNKGLTLGPNLERNKNISKTSSANSYSRYLSGLVTERSVIRKHLSTDKGYACSKCRISEWNNEPITLQVDHIDGNAGNNVPDNLRLICPNCHSQTPTFGARNKGKGRKARGLPLK